MFKRGDEMIEVPVCCGKQMRFSLDLGRFMEVCCEKCGDIVYVKKFGSQKPVLLDD